MNCSICCHSGILIYNNKNGWICSTCSTRINDAERERIIRKNIVIKKKYNENRKELLKKISKEEVKNND